MSWPLVPLGQICEFKYGKSLAASVRDGGELPVYGSNGVVGKHSEAITDGATIVIGRKGSIGELNYSSTSCWPIDTTYYVDKSCTKADLRWLFHALAGLRMPEMNKAAAIPGLNRNDAYAKFLRLPPLPEQRRIAAILDKADALRTKRRDAIAKLDQLLQSVFLDMFGDPVTNPKGWPFMPLGELVSRKTINGAYYPAEKYVTEGGVPMVHMSDAFYGVVRRTSLKRVDVSEGDKSKYQITCADILVSRRSLNYEGSAKPCLVDDIGESLIFESSLIRVTPDPNKASPLYLHHYLSNPRARSKYVFKHVTSATISGINQAGLNAIEIMLPGRKEQRHYESFCQGHAQNRLRLEAQANMLDKTFSSIQSAAFSGTL